MEGLRKKVPLQNLIKTKIHYTGIQFFNIFVSWVEQLIWHMTYTGNYISCQS